MYMYIVTALGVLCCFACTTCEIIHLLDLLVGLDPEGGSEVKGEGLESSGCNWPLI